MTSIICDLKQWQSRFLTILWIDWIWLGGLPVSHCEMRSLTGLHSAGSSFGPGMSNMASQLLRSLHVGSFISVV